MHSHVELIQWWSNCTGRLRQSTRPQIVKMLHSLILTRCCKDWFSHGACISPLRQKYFVANIAFQNFFHRLSWIESTVYSRGSPIFSHLLSTLKKIVTISGQEPLMSYITYIYSRRIKPLIKELATHTSKMQQIFSMNQFCIKKNAHRKACDMNFLSCIQSFSQFDDCHCMRGVCWSHFFPLMLSLMQLFKCSSISPGLNLDFVTFMSEKAASQRCVEPNQADAFRAAGWVFLRWDILCIWLDWNGMWIPKCIHIDSLIFFLFFLDVILTFFV